MRSGLHQLGGPGCCTPTSNLQAPPHLHIPVSSIRGPVVLKPEQLVHVVQRLSEGGCRGAAVRAAQDACGHFKIAAVCCGRWEL